MDAGAQKDMQMERLATDYQRHLHIDRINIICIINSPSDHKKLFMKVLGAGT